MKKSLLTILLAGSSILGYSQFTPGNLVVLRQNSTGVGPSVSLVEYTRTGVAVSTALDFPSSGAGDKVVLNSGAGGATFEGFLKLSSDLNYLTFGGYKADAGTTSLSTSNAATTPRVAVRVNINKAVNYKLTTATTGKYIRSVVSTNGTDAWVSGNTSITRYLDISGTAVEDGADVLTPALTATTTDIFQNHLYFTRTGTGVAGLWRVDPVTANTLPKSASEVAGMSLMINPSNNATDFLFFDTDNNLEPDLLYIGTDGVGTANLYKYKLEEGIWVAKGSTGAPAELTSNNRKVQGITGHVAGGKYVIYYSTFSNILSFVDDAAPSENLSISPDPATPETPGAPKILVTADAGTTFRGLAFTPGSTPAILPVELKSFSGKAQGATVRLDWTTASETNNSHFEVLRSGNGDPNTVIGSVPGQGNSSAPKTYSFIDEKPLAGLNYYQLNQVDLDGKSQKSKVIDVKSGLKELEFTVSSGRAATVAQIYSAVKASAILSVSDVSGRKLIEQKVQLESGQNSVSLNVSGSGVYVATLSVSGKNISVKFIK